jgi:Icc protein
MHLAVAILGEGNPIIIRGTIPMSDFPPSTATGKRALSLKPIRILQLTDFHFLSQDQSTLLGVDTEHSFSNVLATALKSRPSPDAALLTGDLTQDGDASAYERLRKRLTALPCPGYCLPGNHDNPDLIAQLLLGGNLRSQSQILLGSWQIICLDSTIPDQPHGRLAKAQLELLETALHCEPDRFALIALHHHPIPCGSPWMDSLMLENADRLFEILAKYHSVRGVVFGHIHQALDRFHNDLRLLGTPSTCFQFKPYQAEFTLDSIPPGYRWIELHPDGRLDTEVGRAPELEVTLDLSSQGY